MSDRPEQRYRFIFCQELGDSQDGTIRKIQPVFVGDTIGFTQIKEWYNQFLNDRTIVESELLSDRPSSCQNEQILHGNWWLHHANAWTYSSHMIGTFWAKNQTSVVKQAPNFPDMSLCCFWLLPKLKRPLNVTWFQTTEGIMSANNSRAKRHLERSFLRILTTMAAPLGEVCGGPRNLFWGW